VCHAHALASTLPAGQHAPRLEAHGYLRNHLLEPFLWQKNPRYHVLQQCKLLSYHHRCSVHSGHLHSARQKVQPPRNVPNKLPASNDYVRPYRQRYCQQAVLQRYLHQVLNIALLHIEPLGESVSDRETFVPQKNDSIFSTAKVCAAPSSWAHPSSQTTGQESRPSSTCTQVLDP
jgi:hypothetical protein